MADFDFGQTRKMPYSLDAEQAVLGSVMIDPESFEKIAGIIDSTDFYLEEHRDIYLAMQKLFLDSRQIDLVTLIDRLVENGVKDRERTVAYVKVLAEAVPTAANIKDYAEIVKNKITGLSAGITTLTAKYENFDYKVIVYVENPVVAANGVTGFYPKYTINMSVGQTVVLKELKTYQNVLYRSNKNEIAFVDEAGVLTARRSGTATITAKVN